jgi:hypothetical protein
MDCEGVEGISGGAGVSGVGGGISGAEGLLVGVVVVTGGGGVGATAALSAGGLVLGVVFELGLSDGVISVFTSGADTGGPAFSTIGGGGFGRCRSSAGGSCGRRLRDGSTGGLATASSELRGGDLGGDLGGDVGGGDVGGGDLGGGDLGGGGLGGGLDWGGGLIEERSCLDGALGVERGGGGSIFSADVRPAGTLIVCLHLGQRTTFPENRSGTINTRPHEQGNWSGIAGLWSQTKDYRGNWDDKLSLAARRRGVNYLSA